MNEPIIPTPEGMETVPINDLDQFINQLVHWHNGAKARVQHATTIPDDGSITMEYEGQDHVMAGDKRTGFVMGLCYAYSELGTLPFGFREVPVDDAANEASGDQPAA